VSRTEARDCFLVAKVSVSSGHCENVTENGVNKTRCVCQEDLCNTGPTLYAGFKLHRLFLLLTMFVTKNIFRLNSIML
jgi:hypothetical protein